MSLLAKIAIKLLINALIIGGSATIIFIILFAPNMAMTFKFAYGSDSSKYGNALDLALVEKCQKNDYGIFCEEKKSGTVDIGGGSMAYDLSFIPKDQKLYNAVLAITISENSTRTVNGDRDSCGGGQQRLSEVISPGSATYQSSQAILRERGKSIDNFITPQERITLQAQVEADNSNDTTQEKNAGITRDGGAKIYKGMPAICKRLTDSLGNSYFDQLMIKRLENEGVWGTDKEKKSLNELEINDSNYLSKLANILVATQRPALSEYPKWKERLITKMKNNKNYTDGFKRAQTACNCGGIACKPKENITTNLIAYVKR